MLQIHLFFLLVTLLAAPATALELPGTCRVAFAASSTLHDFDGTADCTPFVLTVTETPEGERHTGVVALSVPVAGMRTGIERRDQAMREMFEAGRFPQIVGQLSAAPLAELRRRLQEAAGNDQGVPLLLRIRTIERPVTARVSKLTDASSGFDVELQFPVSLAAYDLEPPVVLGFIRVADEVSVRVVVKLAPLPPPWPP